MIKKKISLVLKIVAALIMLQTLYFKFTGAQESIDLFSKIVSENEVYMRIGTGILELIASVLLFVPRATWLGALLGAGLMGGAIMSHLTIIGIKHNNDGGTLFISALAVFIASTILLFLNRKNIPIIGNRL